MKIGIIGGGASGLLTAIFSKSKNNDVIIFERNNICGKKILATGNGRCNYWNDDQALFHYQSSNKELISKIVNKDIDNKVLKFFDRLGIVPKIKNCYYYPFSNQASTIKNALENEVERLGIKVKNNFLVEDIVSKDNKFIVVGNTEQVTVDKLVIATGSCASPKSGSDGMGYDFLRKMGHSIIKPLPSLVQLKTKGKYLKTWSGVRTDVKVTLYENNEFVREESGEIQLTNYGISGICVFNLSNRVSRGLDNNKKEEIFINFMPFIEEDKSLWFTNQTNLTNKNIYELLLSVLNPKIVEVIFMESKVDKDKYFNKLSDSEKENLINYCTNFKVEIIDTNSFNDAQVCSGGLNLSEINLDTMESKIINNLYVTGELLDITGDCGGYNLGIAWRTGILAGNSIRGSDD